MRESLRRALAGLLAIMLVSGAMSPVGTAAANHRCEFSDSLTLSVINSVDQDLTEQDCTLFHGDTDVSDGLDKAQAKESIITAAATTTQQSKTYVTSYENAIQGTQTLARMDGLATYFRSLNNGSSEAEARIKANRSVEDFYSVRQENLAAGWNLFMVAWADYEHRADTEGIDNDFVGTRDYDGDDVGWRDHFMTPELSNASVRTVNETQITVSRNTFGNAGYVGLTSQTLEDGSLYPLRYQAGMFNDSYSTVRTFEVNRFRDLWTQIEQQSEDVKAGLTTYIAETYPEYQAGDLNATEIAGASTLSREFSADGDFQSWAAMRLSMMEGADPPEDLSQTGFYRISHDTDTYEGMLVSDGNPESGAYESGETYNGTKLTGPQYVVTENSSVPLDGEFTIESITNDEGEQVNKTVIREVSYETQNISDYKELVNEMQDMRAELEAREQKQRTGGNIGFSDLVGGLPYGGVGVVVVVLSLLGLAAVSRSN